MCECVQLLAASLSDTKLNEGNFSEEAQAIEQSAGVKAALVAELPGAGSCACILPVHMEHSRLTGLSCCRHCHMPFVVKMGKNVSLEASDS